MAQPIITKFWPVFVRRSDGKAEVQQRGLVTRNGPAKAQLDRTPNEKGQQDYYRELDREEPKHVDWRKKLGGMLVREIGGKEHADKATVSILWELPEGYRLYEHIKSKADGTKATKNHSGGGHDRQDAYLYGHPRGPKKRFRSPVEFFPHLLWLSTDQTGDYANCTCKLCCPEQIEVEKPAVKPEPKAETPAIKKEDSSKGTPVAAVAAIAANPANPARPPSTNNQQPRRPSAPSTPLQSPAPKPAIPSTAGSTIPRPRTPVLAPSPLPQPRSINQQLDSSYDKFVCRVGEVVWFSRGSTWALGLVIRRWIPKAGSASRAYQIQPLSHPFDMKNSVSVEGDDMVKPWLAWSSPAPTYTYLRQNPLSYEQVDWHGLMLGQYGGSENNSHNSEVDASILAARRADATYTLFDHITTTSTPDGQQERHYNGLFYGCERIWNGDPVRLRTGSGTDILVITNIIERPVADQPAAVYLLGDVYTCDPVPVPDPSKPPAMPSQTHLPIRMRQDMLWRNNLLLSNKRVQTYWKLTAAQTRMELGDIKGRWYESSILFITQFHDAIKNGDDTESIWMNDRGGAMGIGRALGDRKEERLQALLPAVPNDTALSEELEPPPPPQTQQDQAHPMQNLGDMSMDTSGQDNGFPDLNEFMNLDGDDMGFNGFGGNNTAFHFG